MISNGRYRYHLQDIDEALKNASGLNTMGIALLTLRIDEAKEFQDANSEEAAKIQTELGLPAATEYKNSEECEHGNIGYCGLCMAENEPKCIHGNIGYCGFCQK